MFNQLTGIHVISYRVAIEASEEQRKFTYRACLSQLQSGLLSHLAQYEDPLSLNFIWLPPRTSFPPHVMAQEYRFGVIITYCNLLDCPLGEYITLLHAVPEDFETYKVFTESKGDVYLFRLEHYSWGRQRFKLWKRVE